MRTRALAICFLLLSLGSSLVGCSDDSYDGSLERLSRLLREKPIGDSTDQWIEKYSTLANEWQRTGLIFGYADDYEACLEFIRGLTDQYPSNRYRCVPAN